MGEVAAQRWVRVMPATVAFHHPPPAPSHEGRGI